MTQSRDVDGETGRPYQLPLDFGDTLEVLAAERE